ncbi:hypothetical protein [Prochlorococcus sp. MIT 1223]|uniref:hypothetical protein n=1 Tax=Prochlorococcus sp. MIT 1223 TaxID=3096217 RepID=UPI002A74E51E|nr:hypothetical protein [Prochlorococcus sp. MIT 1223]
MSIGSIYLESVTTGMIASKKLDWITLHQFEFSRCELAAAIKLGRMIDKGILQTY